MGGCKGVAHVNVMCFPIGIVKVHLFHALGFGYVAWFLIHEMTVPNLFNYSSKKLFELGAHKGVMQQHAF